MEFFGTGWTKEESLAEPTDQHTTLPSKKIVTRVSASNPGNFHTFFTSKNLSTNEVLLKYLFQISLSGYGATCIALLASATTILKEKEKLPSTGGVLPPGACFAKTNLISTLSKNGFAFEVISVQETDNASN